MPRSYKKKNNPNSRAVGNNNDESENNKGEN